MAAAPLSSLPELLARVQSTDPTDADAVKACCAAVYGVDLATFFLGESYHPGGKDLTRRLAEALALQPEESVLDVASGIGTSALLLAADSAVRVLGVDLGDAQVIEARSRAHRAGFGDRVRFEVGDAERLPVESDKFDAVVCECAFCTFPDKTTAAAELARVLRPGGRVGITDVWLDPATLDEELASLAGRIACLADARPVEELIALLEGAGLRVERVEHHDDALARSIERVETRLRALRLVDLPLLRSFDLHRGISLARRAANMVASGNAGYVLVVATKRIDARTPAIVSPRSAT
jgi:arsenite methyltransferase